MRPASCVSHSYEDTLATAASFARVLRKGDIVCLYGDLGAGKTAFVKGLAKGLRVDPAHVHSPTFTLMNIYHGKLPLYHFDLYRIGFRDLLDLGYEEFFFGQGVTAVEWSERLEGLAPRECWKVELRHAGEDQRKIRIRACGAMLQERWEHARLAFAHGKAAAKPVRHAASGGAARLRSSAVKGER